MNSFYFWDEMAAKCLKSEHFQEAIQSYKHALESTDENAEQASVWANIGNIYLTLQDIPSAVDSFLTASRLDPSSYDFECILERITANGYLDESAMIMAKDMYALESVKTSLDVEVGVDQFPEKASVAEDENASVVESAAAVPATDVAPSEVIAEVEVAETVPATETPDAAAEVAIPEPVAQTEQPEAAVGIEPAEPTSSEETSQPVADAAQPEVTVEVAETVPATETPDAAAEVAIPEPVAQTEQPEAAVELEPAEPTSSEETSQPVADEVQPEVIVKVAETVPVTETPDAAAEVAIPEPVAQSELPEATAEIEPAEIVFSEESSQSVVDAVLSEVAAQVEAAEIAQASETPETAAEAAIPELVAEETNPEMRTVIETPGPTADDETTIVSAVVTGVEEAAKPETPQAYIMIPVAEILGNPLHLRVSMQSEDLVESVRQYGILQPLVVTRMDDGKYMVVTGNRRLEAARLVGLELVPAVVRSATECEFLELALIENIQRVNLDPLELAEAYHLLVENFGMSVDLIAASIGKSCSVVVAALNLLKLTEEGKQALQEKSISEGHARSLVEIDLPALQNNALVYVLENRLGVHQTEDLVRIILNAVAVSRSYDESYHEEAVSELPQEPEPDESAEETAVESLEIESAVEMELPSAETDPVLDIVVESEVTQAVAEAPATNPEPEMMEATSVVEPETIPDVVSVVEQPVEVEMTDDAIMDLLVAESVKAEALLDDNATENTVEQISNDPVLEDESIDFYWIKPEAANQVQQDGIQSPVSTELLVEESFEKDTLPVAIPAELMFAVLNGDTTRDMVIQPETIVADSAPSPVLETVIQVAEEDLDDVIEEIVQFTNEGDSPLSATHAEANTDQIPVIPEPVAELEGPETSSQKESDETETRTQLKGLEAIAVYRRVVENNPANVRIWHLLGNLYSDIGQYEEAIDCLKRTVELDPSKYTYFYHLGLTLAIARYYPEAIQALEKTIELAPQHILAHCSLAGCYRRIGNEVEAQQHIETAKPKLMQEKAYNRACFESISGNSDQAIELLQIALDTDKTPVEWLVRDPDLDFIRDDPRFQALIGELKLPV